MTAYVFLKALRQDSFFFFWLFLSTLAAAASVGSQGRALSGFRCPFPRLEQCSLGCIPDWSPYDCVPDTLV